MVFCYPYKINTIIYVIVNRVIIRKKNIILYSISFYTIMCVTLVFDKYYYYIILQWYIILFYVFIRKYLICFITNINTDIVIID